MSNALHRYEVLDNSDVLQVMGECYNCGEWLHCPLSVRHEYQEEVGRPGKMGGQFK